MSKIWRGNGPHSMAIYWYGRILSIFDFCFFFCYNFIYDRLKSYIVVIINLLAQYRWRPLAVEKINLCMICWHIQMSWATMTMNNVQDQPQQRTFFVSHPKLKPKLKPKPKPLFVPSKTRDKRNTFFKELNFKQCCFFFVK